MKCVEAVIKKQMSVEMKDFLILTDIVSLV